jgi:hypothetical protein
MEAEEEGAVQDRKVCVRDAAPSAHRLDKNYSGESCLRRESTRRGKNQNNCAQYTLSNQR